MYIAPAVFIPENKNSAGKKIPTPLLYNIINGSMKRGMKVEEKISQGE